MKQKVTDKNSKPDLIVILGLKHGPRWGMRKDLRIRLQKAAELYQENPNARIVVSGRWSIKYDWLGIEPPVTESELMKNYLIRRGVKSSDIAMETRSKDTIGNAYYVKKYAKTKPQYKELTILCPAQRIKRIKFLFHKFFGDGYSLKFLVVEAPSFKEEPTDNELRCLKEQREVLAKVRPGHEEDFGHKLYKSAYYTRQAKLVNAR